MPFVTPLLTRLQASAASLRDTCRQLRRRTDEDALHQLRVGLRSLRSLLRPLRQFDDVAALYAAATELSRLSAPARDLEVLITELERHGLHSAAATRRQLLEAHYAEIATAPDLHTLHEGLATCLAYFQAHPEALRRHKPRVERSLEKTLARLRAALADLRYDRHRLRLLVKRVRYAAEAYPSLLPLPKPVPAQLKVLQTALGDWHDRQQWCLRAGAEADLASLRGTWESARARHRTRAEAELRVLLRLLEKG